MATINESGKLIGLTTSSGVVYVPSSQIASFKAGGAGTIVQTLIKGKPDTLNCVESVSDIAAQGNFFPVTLVSGGTLYLNSNRVSYIEATGSGSTILYEPVNVFDKATVTESPAAVKTLMDNLFVAGTQNFKWATITWDSAVNGPFSGFGIGSEIVGSYGTPGMAVTPILSYAYFDNISTGFIGGSSGTVNANLWLVGDPSTGNPIHYVYYDDNTGDVFPGITAYLNSGNFSPAQVTFTDAVNPPGKVYWYAENPGGDFDVTGKFILNICYLEVTP